MLQNATSFFLVIAIPASVHIMAIKRDNHLTQPIGYTIVHEGDTLFLWLMIMKQLMKFYMESDISGYNSLKL